jgi:hypothetical protein
MKALVAIAFSIAMFAKAQAAPIATAKYALAVTGQETSLVEEVRRRGCGSKGGPGYRKANGKCASWR